MSRKLLDGANKPQDIVCWGGIKIDFGAIFSKPLDDKDDPNGE